MPEPSLPLTGGCGCGAVRFEISAPLAGAAYCHCTRCQHRSGAAAAPSARLAPGSFAITAGEEHLHAWSPGGGGFDKVFCGECGSAILAADPESGEARIVRFGAFDDDPGVRPTARQFVASAAPWEPIPDDGLPRFDERMPAEG
ncbi:MAG: GFA family protein [Solirubrobacteraceae bacterium]